MTAWVYIMANRYRGSLYIGVTSNLPARIAAHKEGRGSKYALERGIDRLVWAEQTPDMMDAITHEKRLKRWLRPWKFALIERGNPDWQDLFEVSHP